MSSSAMPKQDVVRGALANERLLLVELPAGRLPPHELVVELPRPRQGAGPPEGQELTA